jgi:hypothetical protein
VPTLADIGDGAVPVSGVAPVELPVALGGRVTPSPDAESVPPATGDAVGDGVVGSWASSELAIDDGTCPPVVTVEETSVTDGPVGTVAGGVVMPVALVGV